MIDKKKEEKYFRQLEEQFKEMKRDEYTESKKIAALQLQLQSETEAMA